MYLMFILAAQRDCMHSVHRFVCQRSVTWVSSRADGLQQRGTGALYGGAQSSNFEREQARCVNVYYFGHNACPRTRRLSVLSSRSVENWLTGVLESLFDNFKRHAGPHLPQDENRAGARRRGWNVNVNRCWSS